ncbi:C-5 sterol desaturase [Arthroderma uncinatum]|uniref:C-5 sterol desaturase n=1 Tax=Arthroderma uncinatum TaxID=74035 RepID=UPI00144AEFF7|nr:C-5 sterol desaturase [Arthroderma uncinatum]KAF3483605.1 C-5 sterol desaturase [Arthroderma uncinatum]
MDVVLEVFDTFVFDFLYATALPLSAASSDVVSNVFNGVNSTAASAIAQVNGKGNGFVYTPSTEYFSLEPFQSAYQSSLPRDNGFRQVFSLFLITWVFGLVLYFTVASLSYVFVFDKTAFNHPKYLKNQISQEIGQAMHSMPLMAVLTAPIFLIEIKGYSKIYDTLEEAPFPMYNYLQFPLFLLFTDFCIYWIHRGLHHPLVYKKVHKPHHKWIMPTPYASHAFHPLDGWSQGLPYHIFPFIFPLQKFAYVLLFVAINVWTVMIHDGEYVANSPILNGAACHTMHHLYFNYNYGQFTTLWDRLGNSYRKPNDELFRRETKMGQDEWNRQAKEMEEMVKQVEGSDDRTYDSGETKKDL